MRAQRATAPSRHRQRASALMSFLCIQGWSQYGPRQRRWPISLEGFSGEISGLTQRSTLRG